MDYIGKIGFFNSKEDKAWGHYAGKECTVISYDDVIHKDGLLVEFNDKQRLTVGFDEFTLILA